MINIGIDGAGSPEGGELIRLLINHPDVELQQVCEPSLSGRQVSDIHHGLLGERPLTFCNSLDLSGLDIVFATSSASREYDQSGETEGSLVRHAPEFLVSLCGADPLIDSSAPYFVECAEPDREGEENTSWLEERLVYGVPELNRKPMVRGARRAVVPTCIESVAVVALLPLAKARILPPSVSLEISAPSGVVAELAGRLDAINRRLSSLMSEFCVGPVQIKVSLNADVSTRRGMRLCSNIAASATSEDAKRCFLKEYDDHNLAHLSEKPLRYEEAEGTDNCLVRYSQLPDGLLAVEAIADARLRGGAGEAVHVMNLFAGLYEKTGLNLKVSTF